MATNLGIDLALLDHAFELSGEKTKAAVTLALEESIARREQVKILDLMGSLAWDDTFDYKAARDRG